MVGLLLLTIKNKMCMEQHLEPGAEFLNPAKRKQGFTGSRVLEELHGDVVAHPTNEGL